MVRMLVPQKLSNSPCYAGNITVLQWYQQERQNGGEGYKWAKNELDDKVQRSYR